MNHKLTPTCAKSREDIRQAIYRLVIQGKLDAVDLKIIDFKYCPTMPGLREVSEYLNIPLSTTHFKLERIKALIINALSDEIPCVIGKKLPIDDGECKATKSH